MRVFFTFFAFVLAMGLTGSIAAETVEVAPGIHVTKKQYAAPANEQPFFGFIDKAPAQIAADEKFVSQIVQLSTSRQRALEETLRRGWYAFAAGDLATAGRRFNHAYLITPDESRIYQAFAVLAHVRFNDATYADELFRIALKQPNPAPTLRADYGRFLLITKRVAEARPILEQAVRDAPKFGNAWSNLAFARLQTGDPSGACRAAVEAEKLSSADIKSDIALLQRDAKC